MLCISEQTESLSERGGAAGMFVATGLVTEPGLKITTSNDNCLANVVCGDRGYVTLTFSQPVKDPVFSFAGWGGAASGVSWSELKLVTPGVTLTQLSGTNINITQDGTYIEDNGQASTTRCNASTTASSAVCGSVQINGTVTTVRFQVFMQTSGGTGNEDAWNLTASMAEDFGLVPSTYETSGVASHGVGDLRMGATVAADQASTLYATTNADAVVRWTSLATNAKKDDGIAAWVDSPSVTVATGATYSVTVSLANVTSTANLCGWIDWNRDEVFDYSERACASDPPSGASTATLSWLVPSNKGVGLTYARVRLSYEAVNLPTGKVASGEVEDYSLTLASSALPAANNDTSLNGQDVDQAISPLANDEFEVLYPVNTASLRLCGTLETPASCTQTTLTVTGEGTYTVNTSTGVVTFNPLPSFTGTATSVRYQISDTQGTPATVSALITPTVYPQPTATADTTSGLLNQSQTKDPLANDASGDASAPLDVTSVRLCGASQTSPNCSQTSVSVVGGVYSVSTSTGVITFVPTTDFVGEAPAVTYQVSDSLDQVASSTYTPTVTGTPSAAVDTSIANWNVDQTIAPLTNDTAATGYALGGVKLCGTSPVESPNSCSQTILEMSEGTYTVNVDGTVTFDPLPSFHGTATPVTYQANDSLGQYVSSTITPTVRPPTAPTANADSSQNLVNTTQQVNVLANDSTVDVLITLTASTVRLCGVAPSAETPPSCTQTSVAVANGSYSVDGTGVVSFIPATDWSGTPTPITYQVTSSTNQTVSSTYSPVVLAQPSGVNDTSSGAWNVNQVISPLTNDTIATGHPLNTLKLCGVDPLQSPNTCDQTVLEIDGEGTYTVNADGTVTFDPLPSFTGYGTPVRYQAIDDLGQYANATITPFVTNPAAPVATNDTSSDYLNVTQTKDPLSNDTTADPLISFVASTVKLCGSGQLSPNCSATTLTVSGGAYSVNATTGVITFIPETGWSGTAPAVTYQVADTTDQVASATYTPTVYARPTALADSSTGLRDVNQQISPLANDT
jgi:CshA-type fibril repeat protein